MANLESFNDYKPVTATFAGFILPFLSGTLSACSSGLIIYIISRSQQKLTTTYHRIMAFMSAFDIISSIFIALGATMVPSGTMYKFAGPMFGNDASCQAQGFLIVFGLCGGTSLNACLALYFVLQIVFKVESSKMSIFVEPIMYIYTLIIASIVPSLYLINDLFHPNPYDSFCTISTYPDSCDESKWYDWNLCTWGENKDTKSFVATLVISLQFGWIVIGMTMILWTTYTRKREVRISNTHDIEQRSTTSKTPDILTDTKALEFQAMMYICAFFLTWLFNLLSVAFGSSNYEMDLLNSILFPLQGFWNLIIFLYDKTYFARQNDDESLSFCQSVRKLISEPSKYLTVLVSNVRTIEQEGTDQTEVIEDLSNPLSELQMSFPINCRYGLSIDSSFFNQHHPGVVSLVDNTSFHNDESSSIGSMTSLRKSCQTIKIEVDDQVAHSSQES
jgi:hypothetical protein